MADNTQSVAGSVFGRALGEAVLAHRITTGETVVALTEGALNLLGKAEQLITNGNPEDRRRVLILIGRAVDRLPDPSDIAELPELHDHARRLHELAADLRARAEADVERSSDSAR